MIAGTLIRVPSISKIEMEKNKLFKKWHWKRHTCKFPQFIDDRFKDLNELLKKKMPSHIKAYQILQTLDYLLVNPEELDINMIMLLTERKDKISTFITYMNVMDDETYWRQLSNAYTLQDFVHIPYFILASLFLSEREGKEYLYDPKDIEFMNELPDIVSIYRGCHRNELETQQFGLSWTLDKKVADFFANRNTKMFKGDIMELKIQKDQIVAYFLSPEKEIIYISEWLRRIFM